MPLAGSSGTTLAHSAQLIYVSAHPFHFHSPHFSLSHKENPCWRKRSQQSLPAQCINLKPQGMSAGKADYFPCIETIYFIRISFFSLERSIPVFFLTFPLFSPFFWGGFYFFSFFVVVGVCFVRLRVDSFKTKLVYFAVRKICRRRSIYILKVETLRRRSSDRDLCPPPLSSSCSSFASRSRWQWASYELLLTQLNAGLIAL